MAHFLDFHDGVLTVSGDWTLGNARALQDATTSLPPYSKEGVLKADINRLDMAGAALLHDLVRTLAGPGMKEKSAEAIQGLKPEQLALMRLIRENDQEAPEPIQEDGALLRGLTELGHLSLTIWADFLDLVRFIGETTIHLGSWLRHPGHMRLSSIIRHIRETGLAAVPIVSLIAFLISIVLAYQGANQLRRFGAEIFTINMVAISVLREMGVLLTAIMIAGRSGSAFTAEIGVMKVNEEVDAMRVIGINPFDVLVLPRVLALIIALPLLTFIADIMGLLGGGIISYSLINIGFDQYLDRFRDAVGMSDFWVGMIKAPVFAFFIAIVGCMRGMQVSGSAESVGRLTTTSVVQSIFVVLLLDALFSILFTKLGV